MMAMMMMMVMVMVRLLLLLLLMSINGPKQDLSKPAKDDMAGAFVASADKVERTEQVLDITIIAFDWQAIE